MKLSISSVGKSFKGSAALSDINLELESGEFLGILGPSGCGKSTLLRCLAGLEHPDTGKISFADRVVFDAVSKTSVSSTRRNIGMVFQDLALWPHLSAFENVAFPLKARKFQGSIKDEVNRALELVHLGDLAQRFPHQLSGGQQQRVAFARAIVGNPSLLLMDEPLSALDAALKAELRVELANLTRQLGLTTVYVTHDQSEAMSMADRIVVMKSGVIQQYSTPQELYENPRNEFVAKFVGRLNVIPGAAGGIRPEKTEILLDATSVSDQVFEGVVSSSSYLGGRYEVRVSIPGIEEDWVSYSEAPYRAGDLVRLAAPVPARIALTAAV